MNSVSACLPCHLSKGPLKWDFIDIYLTSFFAVHQFKYTSAMRVIFFLKMFKIESKFTKCKKKKNKKKIEKIFFVSHIIESKNVQQIASLKKIIPLIGSQWVEKQSYHFAYRSERRFKPALYWQVSINIVKVPSFSFEQCFSQFTMILVEGPLKRDCLDIYRTMSFGLRKFINTSAMKVIHFLKMFKIECKFTKWKNKFWNCFWFLR